MSPELYERMKARLVGIWGGYSLVGRTKTGLNGVVLS
jgi:hypothetical protein